jgi:ATP-binding cassette, subfamily F, member 3
MSAPAVELKDLRKSFGKTEIIRGTNLMVAPGERVAIIGPNGAGKSTLLRALFGEHPVEAGTLQTGASVAAGFYRQDLSQVPLEQTLYDVINDLRPHWERRLIQGHLGRFGFSGDEVLRRASTLSGGERARVALAMLMLSRANLLVLDEPTNHLDVESIEALEDAIERYDGTVILVSHDRELLRALTTRLWILHDRRVIEFDGGFAEWEVVSAEREHAARVKAEEDAALQQLHERQRVARESRRGRETRGEERKRRTQAQQSLEAAEARVMELEQRVTSLTSALEDPSLYTRPAGVGEARRLGEELEQVKRQLDQALGDWERASARVDASS